MKKIDNSIKITGMIIAAVIILALLGFSLIIRINPTETVSADGVATIEVMPDLVSINFNVETIAKTAKEAKDANALIVDAVVAALINEGFTEEEITTQNFNVYEEFDWSRSKQTSIGFKATHSIKIELSTKDSDRISGTIDAGIDNGALLSYINFELSQDLQNEYKTQALKLAAEDARIKADAIANGLGAKVGRVVSTSSSNFGYYPWLAYDSAGTSESTSGAKIETEIRPGTQDVTARVSVTYKLR